MSVSVSASVSLYTCVLVFIDICLYYCASVCSCLWVHTCVFVCVRSVDVSGCPCICVGVCLYDGGCVSVSV